MVPRALPPVQAVRAGDRLKRPSREIKLALRTTFAAVLTFAVAHVLQLSQGYWAVFTSIVIVQASVGSSLKAGTDQVLGTAVHLGPVQYAADRVLEIGLGAVVGVAVSLLILPARAQTLLIEATAQAIVTMRECVDLELRDLAQAPDRAALADADQRLSRALSRADGLVDEVRRERANRLSAAPDPAPVLRTLRRLRHDTTAVGLAVIEPLPHAAHLHLEAAAGDLKRAISECLSASADAVRGRGPAPSLQPVDTALSAFHVAMERLRHSGTLREASVEVVARVFGLYFALQQLRGDLGDLADAIAEHARHGRAE